MTSRETCFLCSIHMVRGFENVCEIISDWASKSLEKVYNELFTERKNGNFLRNCKCRDWECVRITWTTCKIRHHVLRAELTTSYLNFSLYPEYCILKTLSLTFSTLLSWSVENYLCPRSQPNTKYKTRRLIRLTRRTETMTDLKSGSNKTAATLWS